MVDLHDNYLEDDAGNGNGDGEGEEGAKSVESTESIKPLPLIQYPDAGGGPIRVINPQLQTEIDLHAMSDDERARFFAKLEKMAEAAVPSGYYVRHARGRSVGSQRLILCPPNWTRENPPEGIIDYSVLGGELGIKEMRSAVNGGELALLAAVLTRYPEIVEIYGEPAEAPTEDRFALKETQLGDWRYVPAKDGTISIFDTRTGDAVSLEKMAPKERESFFSELAEIAKAQLPSDCKIEVRGKKIYLVRPIDIRDRPSGLIVPEKYSEDGLKIEWVRSDVKGGGLLLMAEALKKYPETAEIYGELDETNLSVYTEACRAGMNHWDALRQTPAYKTRARCGFTQVVEVSPTHGHMARPILLTIRG